MNSYGVVVLLDAAVKGGLILAGSGFLALLLRRAPAAVRHVVWTVALVGVLLQPLISPSLSLWRLPVFAAPTAVAVAASPAPAGSAMPAAAGVPREPGAAAASDPVVARRGLPTGARTPQAPGRWIVAGWLAGTTLVALRLLVGRVRLRRLLSAARPLTAEPWLRDMAECSARLGIRRQVRLLETAADVVPFACGVLRPAVVVPGKAHAWPADRRRIVLLHELVHVRRWDCMTQALAQAACALRWFDPLTWIASSRLVTERERACDERVVGSGTLPSVYANHLLGVVQSLQPMSPPPCVAFGRASHLERRIRAIIEAHVAERHATRRRLLLAAVAATVLSLPWTTLQLWDRPPRLGSPLAAQEGAAPGAPAAASAESQADEEFRVLWSSARGEFEVAARGTIHLTADESAIATIEKGGHFWIRHRSPAGVRHLFMDGLGGVEYSVDGASRPFDAVARRWLAELLPEIVDETGFGAGTRVARLLRAGGVAAVLQEVAHNEKPRVQRVFLREALQRLSGSSDLHDVAHFAAAELSGDGELASFLYASAGLYLGAAEDRKVFLEAASAITGEDEYARFMVELLRSADEALTAELIRAASQRLESDETRAGFLAAVAAQAPRRVPSEPAFLEAFAALANEDIVARLAIRLLALEEIEPGDRREVFVRAFNKMASEETKAGFLLHLGEDVVDQPELREPFLQAVRSIRGERPRRALDAMLREHGLAL